MSDALALNHTNDPSRAPTPGTVVYCPLKAGAAIAVGRCVEWRAANGCLCGNALPALRAVEAILVQPAFIRSGTSRFPSGLRRPILLDEERERAASLAAVRAAIRELRGDPMAATRETLPLDPPQPRRLTQRTCKHCLHNFTVPRPTGGRMPEYCTAACRRLTHNAIARKWKRLRRATISATYEAPCGWRDSICEKRIDTRRNKSGLCGRHQSVAKMREHRAAAAARRNA